MRRLDPAWGPQSVAAVDDTFHFTNCAPQHHEFNAGRTLWLGLEDYVLQNAVTSDLKVSVLSGPVLDDDDPQYRGVALPLQYWKIVAMMRTDGKPSVTAYLLSQESLLDEFRTDARAHAACCRSRSPTAPIGRSRCRCAGSPPSRAWI